MKFVGLDGLKHFWANAKTWIIDRITTEVTAKIAEIVAKAPEDLDTLKEIADWISSHADDAAAMNTAISTNASDIATLKTSVAGKSDTGHTHTKSEITDFPTSLPANGGKSAKSSFLDEYVGAGGTRPTSGNIIPKDATEYGGMRKDVVTSSMTDSGRPGDDGHLLTMFWDNSGRYDSQFFIKNGATPELKVRGKDNQTDYSSWTDVITSNNIGSQTVAKATNATNDSNGKNIANTYMPKSGGTFNGSVTFEKPTYFNDDIYVKTLFPKNSIDSKFGFFKDTDLDVDLPMIYSWNCGSVFKKDMCLRYYTLNCSNKNEALKNLNELKKLFASMYTYDVDGCARCVSIHARLHAEFSNGKSTIIGDIINYGYCECDDIVRVNKDGSVYVGKDFYSNYHTLYISYDDGFKEKDAWYLADEILKSNMSNINYFSFIGNYVLAEHL